MPAPTVAEIERALETREVGARLAQGPWQRLPRDRWGVPGRAYMSLADLGELVLMPTTDGWKVERAKARGEEPVDPVAGWEAGTL